MEPPMSSLNFQHVIGQFGQAAVVRREGQIVTEWVKTSLTALREKVVAGITEKVAPAIAAKAGQAIEWITGMSKSGS